jgi:hypothetical protein
LVRDINVRPNTLKPPEENIGKTLENTVIGKDFLNSTALAQKVRAKIDK